jgi:hypothetical protein
LTQLKTQNFNAPEYMAAKAIGIFSLSTQFVAQPIDHLLQFDDPSASSFVLRHLGTRVMAILNLFFSIIARNFCPRSIE